MLLLALVLVSCMSVLKMIPLCFWNVLGADFLVQVALIVAFGHPFLVESCLACMLSRIFDDDFRLLPL